MPALETYTTIFCCGAVNICVGLIMFVAINKADIVRAHWCVALISFGLASFLIGFHDLLPPWLANVFANMLIGLSVVLIHRGAWIMVGRRPPDVIYGLSIVVLGAIYYQFTYPTPDISARIFAISLFRVPYFVSAALALGTARQFRDLSGARVLIWLLLAGSCWYLIRGGLALSSEDWAQALRLGSLQSVNFVIAAVGNILITVVLSRVEAEEAVRQSSYLATQLQAQSEGLEAAVKLRTRELEQEVSERKQAEIALKAERDRAENALEDLLAARNVLVQAEKMAALGRLVAGVAHEINTPLGVAVTMASLVSERVGDLERAYTAGRLRQSDLKRYISDTREGCDLQMMNLRRAADLVHSFKQVAADQTGDERRTFGLDECLGDIVISIGPLWRKPGHQVSIDCAAIELDSYPGVISQIVTNLVTNSVVHAFEPGRSGVLTLSATLCDPDTVELCYTDNGRGIAQAARERVFDPFYTTKRSAGSTGLGLHIIYNLVANRLGGGISLESEEGQGVRFILRFPRLAPLPGAP